MEHRAEFRGSVEALVGSRDRAGLKASINLPLSDTLFARASILKDDQDGYIKRPYLKGETGDTDALAGRLALRWQPDDAIDINLSLNYADPSTMSGVFLVLL